MKEIRIASANAIFRLNTYIADIECDIDMIERCKKDVYNGGKVRLQLEVEQKYKCVIRQQLVDIKKKLIDMINIDKQAGKCH